MVFTPILIAALLPIAAQAANDWSQPCFGECNWDITTGGGSGTVHITGSQTGISDLTTAAGWTILDCNQNATAQDIRLVCHDSAMGCDHLDLNGAAGTLVRLPQSCGSMPFALVTRKWVHANQTIPASKRSLIMRRDGSEPVVHGISLATDFASVDPEQNGNITMFLQGSSVPGVAGNFTVAPPTAGAVSKRGLFSWVTGTLENLASFNKNITGTSPINFSKDVPLFDQSIDCPASGSIPAFSGEAKVDLNGNVNGNVNYGLAVAGTIVPPKISEFGLFVGLDTTVTGTLNINSSLTGTISTGTIQLFQTGLPGLDFPKIFSLGPTFTVNALADASLDVNLDMAVDIDYTISNAELFFPPNTSPSGGSFVPGDSNIALSVSPEVTSHGQISAHIIPTLAFGISVLDDTAKATINLDVDADAALDLSLTASAQAQTSTSGKSADTQFGGCVDVTTGLSVNAGADASLLSLFDKSTSVSLFSKTFDLFKKCFGSTPSRRAYTGRAERAALMAKRDGVACPGSLLSAAESVVSQAIPASSIL